MTTQVDNRAATTNNDPNPNARTFTYDKIFHLSYKELRKTEYGFIDNYFGDPNKSVRFTDYCIAKGATCADKPYCEYWTRSPSKDSGWAYSVDPTFGMFPLRVSREGICVVPAMNFNLYPED